MELQAQLMIMRAMPMVNIHLTIMAMVMVEMTDVNSEFLGLVCKEQ